MSDTIFIVPARPDGKFRKSIFGLMIAAAAFCSCDKTPSGNNPPVEETPVVRPVELITDSFTGYPSGENACVDSYLTLEFKSSVTLGSEGLITILNESGTEVDRIDMADVAAAESKPQLSTESLFTTAMDAVGAGGYFRIVYYNAVTVSGNTVKVRLHNNALSYGHTYSVVMDESVISGGGFAGVAQGDWTFTVAQKPESTVSEVTVGSRDCDFMTIQGAINYAVGRGQSAEITISVSDGVYDEPLYIRNKNNLTIKGESQDGTILRFDNCNDYNPSTGSGTSRKPSLGSAINTLGGRAVVLVQNCDMLSFENMTLENSHGNGCQAEVIYFNCDDGRLLAKNCTFKSEQDTVEIKGWNLFRDCLIIGDVDFIWGSPKAALFEDCEIRSCWHQYGGYIVQARCYSAADKGVVFLNCDITADDNVSAGTVYLARSSGQTTYYDNVAYVNCTMGSHINATGWYSNPAPNPSKGSEDSGWKEYGSKDASGAAISTSSRYSGSYQIKDAEYGQHFRYAEDIMADCPKGTDWIE